MDLGPDRPRPPGERRCDRLDGGAGRRRPLERAPHRRAGRCLRARLPRPRRRRDRARARAAPRLMARGLALLVLLAFIWGSNWPVMKVVLGEMPVLTFRTLSLLASGPALLAIARARGEKVRLPRGALAPLIAISVFNITAWYLLCAF